MYKVFFVARVKDYNDEYEKMSSKVYAHAKTLPGFISLEEEWKEDEHGTTEITVTSWPSTNSLRIRFLRKFQRYQDVFAERIILNGKARYCRAPNNKHDQHTQAKPTI